MAEFASKAGCSRNRRISSNSIRGFHMFKLLAGKTNKPIDSRLVGAASTVLDHHDSIAVKNKLDLLVSDIAEGDVNEPHCQYQSSR